MYGVTATLQLAKPEEKHLNFFIGMVVAKTAASQVSNRISLGAAPVMASACGVDRRRRRTDIAPDTCPE